MVVPPFRVRTVAPLRHMACRRPRSICSSRARGQDFHRRVGSHRQGCRFPSRSRIRICGVGGDGLWLRDLATQPGALRTLSILLHITVRLVIVYLEYPSIVITYVGLSFILPWGWLVFRELNKSSFCFACFFHIDVHPAAIEFLSFCFCFVGYFFWLYTLTYGIIRSTTQPLHYFPDTALSYPHSCHNPVFHISHLGRS